MREMRAGGVMEAETTGREGGAPPTTKVGCIKTSINDHRRVYICPSVVGMSLYWRGEARDRWSALVF